MSHVTAIVLAAGKGLRLNLKTSKPLVKINSQPLVCFCLKTLSRHPDIKDIIVVVNPRNAKGITRKIKEYRIGKVGAIVLGGRRRQDSVLCGLEAVDRNADLVLIHDAARPFIEKRVISRVIRAAERCGAAVAGVSVKNTIKRAVALGEKSFLIKETLDRNDLWEIQTPQVFKKRLIFKAYKKYGKHRVTDDASLIEKQGFPVRIVKGSSLNIKITTPEDLIFAEALAKKMGL